MKITGYYNEHGYQIESDNPMDDLLYQAGNHALDSHQDGTNTRFQLPLETMKAYCEQTCKDIAEENNAEYIGIEYLEVEPMTNDFCKVRIELVIPSGTEEEVIDSFCQRLRDGDFDDDGIEIQEMD